MGAGRVASAAGGGDLRHERIGSSTPTPIRAVVHDSGARTFIGSASSSTTIGPGAPTKATIPFVILAPTPPQNGQSNVPTRSIRATGTSARPWSPIRTRTSPSPTSANGRSGDSGNRNGTAHHTRRIG